MILIALTGRESTGQVTALINRFDTEKILLIKDFSVTNFPQNAKCEIIEVNTEKDISNLKKELAEKLRKYLDTEFEVALSIASGTGKEHMALISALLSIPVGIKLVAYTKNGVEFLS